LSGHRPQHLAPDEAAWSQVALHNADGRLRSVYGTQVAISGMALGADTWWALAGLSAGMHLHAYIPFEAQPNKWPAKDQELWHELRRRAHVEVLVGGEEYDVTMLHARNAAMLAYGDLIVALFKTSTIKGGTFSAVTAARKTGQPLLVLVVCRF
jgi:hypothetical protein